MSDRHETWSLVSLVSELSLNWVTCGQKVRYNVEFKKKIVNFLEVYYYSLIETWSDYLPLCYLSRFQNGFC